MQNLITLAVFLLYYVAIFFFGFALRCKRDILYPRKNEINARFTWQKKWHKIAYGGLQVMSLLGTSLVCLIFYESVNVSLLTWTFICSVIITYFIFAVLEKVNA